MCTYFKTETDVAQNLANYFSSNFYCLRSFHRKNFKWKKNETTGLISKKRKFCKQNIPKERKQPSVVIPQQGIFYNESILYLWLRNIREVDKGV